MIRVKSANVSRGRYHPKRCKVCGVSDLQVGISATGLCPTHSRQRFEENHTQLVMHSGPWFDHWRRRCLASLGVSVVDGSRVEV